MPVGSQCAAARAERERDVEESRSTGKENVSVERGCARRKSKGSQSGAGGVGLPGITNLPEIPLCAGCGRCCHLVVELRAGDVVDAALTTEHEGVRCMDQRSDGACVALDAATLLCTIYETRPQTCRDFNRGEALCRTVLARAAARRG